MIKKYFRALIVIVLIISTHSTYENNAWGQAEGNWLGGDSATTINKAKSSTNNNDNADKAAADKDTDKAAADKDADKAAADKDEKSVEVELFETKKRLKAAIRGKQEILKLIEAAISEQRDNSIELVDLANQIRKREFEISKSEKRLLELQKDEDVLRAEFADKKHILVELLAGLQKLSHNKPPALLVSPDDILVAIRNAIMLGSVIPNAESETRKLADKLQRLIDVRNEIMVERNQYLSHIKVLRKKHEEIERILDRKKQIIYRSNQKLESENKQIAALSSNSLGLQELIMKLKREEINQEKEYTHWLGSHNKNTTTRYDDIQSENNIDQLDEEEKKRRISLLAQTYLKPETPFEQTKGRLPFPVNGEVLSIFGKDDGLGGIVKGIYVKTKHYAQVISPASGWVEYAGSFRNYGKLLIINAGEGYHIILTGINKLEVFVGQFVFSSEPVGVMGNRAFKSSTKELAIENDKPTLYIEIRKNGISLNPNDWWSEDIKSQVKS